ncbi:DUF1361 domain-containing protein [Zobellia alginiliquefaciens]|uniref:DUF1361 domain-containing protein n=1 Tax=Zobellia alginiliquefaciens TaxID=3032586 RepID=UPI0023E38D63|nr:DUF1361 domain-containing protein [Zobellia alginiliquefaciens]
MIISTLTNNLFHKRLLLLTALGCALLALRVYVTQSIDFTFLLWNLFLALIPLFLSKQFLFNVRVNKSKGFRILILFFWVLFLPNSPYIITDFVHLDDNQPTFWLDLLLFFVFALNGLVLGVLSMMDVFSFLRKRNHPVLANAILLFVSLLSGYGVFLGRFLRFNSWDIVSKPLVLAHSLFNSLFLVDAWLWIFGFGSFIWVSFWALKPFLRGHGTMTISNQKV